MGTSASSLTLPVTIGSPVAVQPAASSSVTSRLAGTSKVMTFFHNAATSISAASQALGTRWWHYWKGDDEEDDEEDKTDKRESLGPTQHVALAGGVALSTAAALSFPEVAVGTAAGATDLIKTWSSFLPKTPELEKRTYAAALLFLMLSIAKEVLDVSDSHFLQVFTLIPWFFFFMGIARVASKKIGIISRVSSKLDTGITLGGRSLRVSREHTELALRFAGGVGLYGLMGYSSSPLVRASLGVLSKAQFRPFADIIGEKVSKRRTPIPQIVGVLLITVVALTTINSYMNWDSSGSMKAISGMVLLVASDTLFRIVKTAIKTAQENNSPQARVASKCLTLLSGSAAAVATVAVATADMGPVGSSLVASLCQESAGLLKIATKKASLKAIAYSTGGITAASTVFNTVTTIRPDLIEGIPPSIIATQATITSIAMGLIFYHLKRAARPDKIKVKKDGKSKKALKGV